MKEILFLTPADGEPALARTGVRQQVRSIETTWTALQESCTDPEIGVVAVDSRLLKEIDPIRLRELTNRWPGVMVTLPAPADRRVPPGDELQPLVQRALGYRVRLQE